MDLYAVCDRRLFCNLDPCVCVCGGGVGLCVCRCICGCGCVCGCLCVWGGCVCGCVCVIFLCGNPHCWRSEMTRTDLVLASSPILVDL